MTGLTSTEVTKLISAGLVNDYEPEPTKKISIIIIKNIFIIFNILLAPLLITLLVMGQYKDVLSVGGIALANTVINIIQEIQAKIALDRIRMDNPAVAMVIRDGQKISIPTKQIVKGDYLVLRSGELALADGPVVYSKNLEMDESMLTGESDYIPKNNKNEILSGSFAVAGEGVYIADRIGADSYMQKVVSQSRKNISKVTPLEKKVNFLVNTFMVCCFFIAAILICKYWPLAGKVEPIRYIVASVTTMIPQGLVLIVSITFALGVIAFAKRGIIFRKMNAVESLSNVDLICMDKTGTLTHNRIKLEKIIPAGNTTLVSLKKDLGVFAEAVSDKNKTIEAINVKYKSVNVEVVDEVPFKSKNKFSVVRVKDKNLTVDMIMGAYELLIPKIKKHNVDKIREQIKLYESKGMRTLVIAKKRAGKNLLKNNLKDFKILGIVTFREEIKKEAPIILKKFAKKGVRQVVISGDSLVTVQSIAIQIGLKNADKGVTGEELSKLNNKAFEKKVLENTIFARISPEQKRDIIKVFKNKGFYTSMVGDGVNDVLALKEANLAIAMGSGGSMAKDVSDIVLVNNKFDLLPELLSEGDKIISRIQDCARIFTLKNFYALFMVLMVFVLGITFPFFPQQITIINFLTITVPLLYLIKFSNYKTKVERSFLPDIVRFSATFGLLIASTGLGLNWLYTSVFKVSVRYAQTTAIFPIILLAILSYLYLLNRAKTFKELFLDKKMFFIAVMLVGFFILSMYVEPLRKFIEIVPLNFNDWLHVSIFSVIAVVIHYYLMKRYMKKLGR